MRLLDAISVLLFLTFISFAATGQHSTDHKIGISTPEVALLALQHELGANVEFWGVAPNVAGEDFTFEKNEDNRVWVNYSSVVRAKQKRQITAKIMGQVPDGIEILVDASTYKGTGKGKLGSPQKNIVLSNKPVSVINNIGTCFTGKGIQNGHLLNYSVKVKSEKAYSQLAQNNTNFQIIYTLTDQN